MSRGRPDLQFYNGCVPGHAGHRYPCPYSELPTRLSGVFHELPGGQRGICQFLGLVLQESVLELGRLITMEGMEGGDIRTSDRLVVQGKLHQR